MTQEELYEQRLMEVKLARALYIEAKADYRKALLGSVSNKLLSPIKRARKEISIVKSRMIAEYESKKQEILLKQIELIDAKNQKLEDATSYIESVKSNAKEFGNNALEGASALFNENLQRGKDTIDNIKSKGINVVNSTSCFMINVKTSLITSLDKRTTLHRDLESKILDYKENKINKEYEKKVEEVRAKQVQEEINNSVAREKEYSDDVTIRERFNKISRNKSYMGTATNRVLDYFRSKKSKLDDKIFDAKVEIAFMGAKVSRTKSKVATAFNSQINNLKNKVDNVIGNTMVALDDRINNVKDTVNDKINDISSVIEHRNEVKQRKEDMISALNEDEKRVNDIRRAQLEMRKQALANINNGDIFSGATPVIERGMKK